MAYRKREISVKSDDIFVKFLYIWLKNKTRTKIYLKILDEKCVLRIKTMLSEWGTPHFPRLISKQKKFYRNQRNARGDLMKSSRNGTF